MKCLTVCQPWAWCIVHGPKRCENRSWRCDYRGPLLIHAGLSRRWMTSATFAELARQGLEPPEPDRLIFGAIIGVCRMTGCVPVAEAGNDVWAVGPWCILLADVRPLAEPIPCQGQLKLFDAPLTPEQQAQAAAALGSR